MFYIQKPLHTCIVCIFYSFDFCQVESGMADKNPPENLGQVVFGERLRASPYIIDYRENKTFATLCKKTYDFSQANDRDKLFFIITRIQEGYMHAWVIDNMPVTWCYKVLNTEKQFCTPRFPVGCYVSKDGTRQESCYISVNKAASIFMIDSCNSTCTIYNVYRVQPIVVRFCQLSATFWSQW